MSFLNTLKKALVTDDAPKAAASGPNGKAAPDYVPPGGVPGPSLAAQGVLDVPNITADIENEIVGSPAFAVYRKFMETVESLKNVPGMDEATRFRAAQATLGLNAEDLTAAVNSHIAVLASSSERFQSEYVAAATSEIEALKGKVETAEQKVQQLTQDLGVASKDKADLVTAIQQKTVDLGKADVDFKGIVAALTMKYKDQVVKVYQHLGAVNVK